MLRSDQRIERLLEDVPLACRVRKRSLKMYKFCGCVGDESRAWRVWRRIDDRSARQGHSLRSYPADALESVLADDDRSTLARLQFLGHQQHPIRNDVGEHIEHNFVAGELRFVIHFSRAWLGRQQRSIESPDDIVVENLTQRLCGLSPLRGIARLAIGFCQSFSRV